MILWKLHVYFIEVSKQWNISTMWYQTSKTTAKKWLQYMSSKKIGTDRLLRLGGHLSENSDLQRSQIFLFLTLSIITHGKT